MKTTIRALVLTAAFAGLTARAEAFPLLQLDIIGGHYDEATQTVISSDVDFTLVALLQPEPGMNIAGLLSQTFFISAGVYPGVGPADSSLGSFSWDGTPYEVTEDMTYGNPPIEADQDHDPGDVSPDGVYPSYFREFSFQFVPGQRSIQYDSADTPGGLDIDGAGTGYYMLFNITTDIAYPYVLHFDLYSERIRACTPVGNCDPDIDTRLAADHKHDAQSINRVPEPASALLLGLGAFGALRTVRRRRVQP